MGLLDSIVGSVLGGGAANSGALSSILGSVLGSQGGVGGLVQKMEQAGLGSVVQSWVGNGQNQPVDPHQLGQALGHDQVKQWSQQSGMSEDSLLHSLSQLLPHAVDQSTPDGKVPDEDSSGGGSPFDQAGMEMPKR